MNFRILNLIVAGFGNVGRVFLKLVQKKGYYLEKRYGLRLTLRVVLELGGGLFSAAPLGLDEPDLADTSIQNLRRHPLWRPGLELAQAVPELSPGILVLTTASSLKTGEPGLSLAERALDSGWHVVTADKAPLVVDFARLNKKAQQRQLSLKYSGATAAALPALDVGLYCLTGADITAIEGILNGTTNFILTEMGKGRGYEESLKEAQAQGIAEPDPSLDVEGWDTAVKLFLIARSVFEADISLQDIAVEGITGLSPDLISRARREGGAVKLLGRIERDQDKIRAYVRPEVLDRSHPLFGVDGANKGITFSTDTMGSITVSGGKSDPRGAAAALLKDILHIAA